MAIQHRRGAYANLDPTKAVPGEVLVVLQDDPTSDDGKAAYMAFAAGDIKRMATYDEVEHFNEESKEYRDDAKDYRDEVISAASTVQTLASEVAMGVGVATDMVTAVQQEGQNAIANISSEKDDAIDEMETDFRSWDEALSFKVVVAEHAIDTKIDELAEPFIKVQDTQPIEEDNKIWVKETPQAEVSVPTYEEFAEVKSAFNEAMDGIGTPGATVTGGVVSFDSTGKTVEQISISNTSATSATLTRTGKNMYPKYSSGSANSLSWTVASDGTLTFTGTPTADVLLRLQNLFLPTNGNTITLSFGNNKTNSRLSFFGINAQNASNHQFNLSSENASETITAVKDWVELRIRIPKDVDMTGLTLKPMMAHGSDGTFEEYTGQTYTVTVEDGVVQDEITLLDGVNTIWSSVNSSYVETSVKFSDEQGKVTDYVAEQIEGVRDSFYSYETSGSARYLFIYYKSGGNYVRWQLHNAPAPNINSDTWQIGRVCGLDSNFGNLTEIVRGGEFELAFKEHGAADYCGGNNHGDESTEVFTLFVDGKQITDLSTLADGKRHPFNRIDAFEIATVNRCDTPAQDILTHQKAWTFENGTVRVRQCIKFLEELSVDTALVCMFAALRSSFTHGIRKYGVEIEDMTTSEYTKKHSTSTDMWYEMYGSNVTAKIRCRTDNAENKSDLWINNTSDLNKLYYGYFGLTNSGNPTTVPQGTIITAESEYDVAYNRTD